MDDQVRSQSFGHVADSYDRYRGSYPPDAVTWALGSGPQDVVEVGAGTGLMTQVLLGQGHRVVAVEPDHQMRQRLVNRCPGAVAAAGSAEDLPVPDASCDAVVAADAFHWFDKVHALPEFARVLRPGGHLVVVWKVADDSVQWVTELNDLLQQLNPSSPGGTGPEVALSPWFGEVEEHWFPYGVAMDTDGLVGRISTWSSVIGSPHRETVLAEVRRFAETHPQLTSKSSFDFPFRTRVIRGVRAEQ
jgi:ubiquinone/menaquinone biosynthesis C-methylase UbiE